MSEQIVNKQSIITASVLELDSSAFLVHFKCTFVGKCLLIDDLVPGEMCIRFIVLLLSSMSISKSRVYYIKTKKK